MSRTALASIPNLSAIGTMRSGRLKTSLRKQFGENCNEYKSVERISLTNYSCNSKDTMFPQCQCRRPSHSPHACGLEAALSSIRNKKTILLLLWFPQIPLLLQFNGPYATTKIDTRMNLSGDTESMSQLSLP